MEHFELIKTCLDTSELPPLESLSAVRREFEKAANQQNAKFWVTLSGQTGVIGEVCQTVMQGVSKQSSELAGEAARLYFDALRIPGASAYAIFNEITMHSVLRLMKDAYIWGNGAPMELDGDLDAPKSIERPVISFEMCMALMKSLGGILEQIPLKGYDDQVTYIIEMLGDFAAASSDISKLAYFALQTLANPMHGSLTDTIPVMLREVMPLILGTAKPQGVGQKPRSQHTNSLDFVLELMKISSEFSDEEGNAAVIQCFVALIQQLCVRAGETQDRRDFCADAVIRILKMLHGAETKRCIEFLTKLSGNAKTQFRLAAVDVSGSLISDVELIEHASVVDGVSMEDVTIALLGIIVGRIEDRGVTVRARALIQISEIVASTQQDKAENITQKVIHHAFGLIPDTGMESTLPGCLSSVLKRTHDERPMVRRAAIAACDALLSASTSAHGFAGRMGLINMLGDACRDAAISSRKQAMAGLTNALVLAMQEKTSGNLPHLISTWVKCVLPLIADSELSVQEKFLMCFDECVLDPAMLLDPNHHVWTLLVSCEDESLRYLSKAFSVLSNWKKLPTNMFPKLIKSLINACSYVNESGMEQFMKGCWTLVDCLAPFHKASPNDIASMVDAVEAYGPGEGSLTHDSVLESHALRTFSSIAANKLVDTNRSAVLKKAVEKRLVRCDAPPILIQAMIQFLAVVDTPPQKKKDEALRADMQPQWCRAALEKYDSQLYSYLIAPKTSSTDDITASRLLYALSEIVIQINANPPQRSVVAVQSLTAATLTAVGGGSGRNVPVSVRANAFAALGKLCMLDPALAKKTIPAFSRELVTATSPVIRNNVVVVLTDLCIRFTSLVDPHIESISSCLCDASPLVRRQTLSLLARLLLQDYIKWKGTLFARIAFMLADQDEFVREFAKSCLLGALKSKLPRSLPTHLIELIFVLNMCTEDSKYNRFNKDPDREAPSDAMRAAFSLTGPENLARRMQIYNSILDIMTDDVKFQTGAKISEDILSSAVEGNLPAAVNIVDSKESLAERGSESAKAVLGDALRILSSPSIRIGTLAPIDVEKEENPLDTAHKKLMSGVLKKHIMENVVPVIAVLRRGMLTNKSPLMKHLNVYLHELVKNYRTEIHDALIGGPEANLVAEIDYDIAQEKALQKEQLKRRSSIHTPSHSPAISPSGRRPLSATPLSTPRLRSQRPENVVSDPRRTVSFPQPTTPASTHKSDEKVPMPTPLAIRLFAEEEESDKKTMEPARKRRNVQKDKELEEDGTEETPIHMHPLDKDLPAPREWQVTSPAKLRPKKSQKGKDKSGSKQGKRGAPKHQEEKKRKKMKQPNLK